MKILSPNGFGTKYISWEGISYIQMKNILVEEPNFVTSYIMYNFSNATIQKWTSYLNETTIRLNKTHLLLNLDEITSENKTKSSNIVNIVFLLLSISGLGVAVTITLWVLNKYVSWKKSKFYKKVKTAEQETNDDIIEDDITHATQHEEEGKYANLLISPAKINVVTTSTNTRKDFVDNDKNIEKLYPQTLKH